MYIYIFFAHYLSLSHFLSPSEIIWISRWIVLLKRIHAYTDMFDDRGTMLKLTLIKLKSPLIAANVILSYPAYYICT